jgi:hypothetical protein
MWQESVLAYFEVLSQILAGGTAKNRKALIRIVIVPAQF